MDLKRAMEALAVFVDQNVGDHIYDVRELEGLGWDGPKVTAWSRASVTANELVTEARKAGFIPYPVSQSQVLSQCSGDSDSL